MQVALAVRRHVLLIEDESKQHRPPEIPAVVRTAGVSGGGVNQVWSVDFVFDRITLGRTLECLAFVDGAAHERSL
jgi:hypothetical protein